MWPGTIAHAAHNVLVDTLGAFTATSYPVLVNLYLVGDNGILILLTTALAAILVGYILRRGLNKPQSGGAVPEATPAAPR